MNDSEIKTCIICLGSVYISCYTIVAQHWNHICKKKLRFGGYFFFHLWLPGIIYTTNFLNTFNCDARGMHCTSKKAKESNKVKFKRLETIQKLLHDFCLQFITNSPRSPVNHGLKNLYLVCPLTVQHLIQYS